jgi:hypothetical protein
MDCGKQTLKIDRDNSDDYGALYKKTRLKSYQLLRDTKKAHAQNAERLISLTEKLIDGLESRLTALG